MTERSGEKLMRMIDASIGQLESKDVAALLARGASGAGDVSVDINLSDDAYETCKRCGRQGFYDFGHTGADGGIRYRWEWAHGLFEGCQLGNFVPGVYCESFCDDCARFMLPALVKMRDLYELRKFVNYLGRAISEQRPKDNRTTARHAG